MFAKNLRYLRKLNGYSQDALAEILGYKSFTTIQKWESEASEPTMRTLKRLSAIFHISMDDLVNCDLALTQEEQHDSSNSRPDFDLNLDSKTDIQLIQIRQMFMEVDEITRDKIFDYVELVHRDCIGKEDPHRLVAEDFCAKKREEAIQALVEEGHKLEAEKKLKNKENVIDLKKHKGALL